jgi:hypothetical protein
MALRTHHPGCGRPLDPHSSGPAPASIIIVEVIGFGGGDGSGEEMRRQGEERRSGQGQTYNLNSPYQVLDVGALADDQVADLAAEKRNQIGR